MMLNKHALYLLAASVLLTACSSNKLLTWTDFAQQSTQDSTLQLQENQGGVVFYRDASDTNKTAVNVSVDGEYLASLLPGGSKQAVVCAHDTKITAMRTSEDVAYLNKLALNGATLPVRAGQVYYVKVTSNADSAPVLTVVDESVAQEALQNTNVQNHTLPRVEKQIACPAPVVAPVAPVAKRIRQ